MIWQGTCVRHPTRLVAGLPHGDAAAPNQLRVVEPIAVIVRRRGLCDAAADAADPLAEFVLGAVDVAKFEERESYALDEARAALKWAPRRLEPLRQAELIVCTFPTVLCVLLSELLPETPQLYVAIANPLFAAPGCTKKEDTTVRECETEEAQEYLLALRQMLTSPDRPVRGISAYTAGGLEAARKKVFPDSIRVADFAHIIGARRNEGNQGSQAMKVWRSGIFKTVDSHLRQGSYLSLVEFAVYTSRCASPGAFAAIWDSTLKFLDNFTPKESAATEALRTYWLEERKDGSGYTACWNIYPSRVQPGSGSGSQSQVTTALVAYQAGVVLPLAGKAGRYLPHEASWQGSESKEALVARSRFLETAFGAAFRNLVKEFKEHLGSSVTFAFQQEAGTYLSYEALSKFRAVVIFAQDLGLHKFTEHYAMGMPIWIPARESAYRLNMFVPWGMVQYSGSFRHGGPSLADETDRRPAQRPRRAAGPGPPAQGDHALPVRLAGPAFLWAILAQAFVAFFWRRAIMAEEDQEWADLQMEILEALEEEDAAPPSTAAASSSSGRTGALVQRTDSRCEFAFAPFFNAQTAPYPLAKTAFWYEFGEFVSYPAVQEFRSIPELVAQLETTDLLQVTQQMRKFRAELWRSTRAVYAAAASELAERARDIAAAVCQDGK
ncbi:hypothetical protein AK812_SmicGene2868 [Symbiodinium microadriaticum]|uniref:Uncharacterized protein n=1 Tax=Symbiodinium microadriaticum TaxID=2951 RepID=A0A1Q9F091_SYMMI|nr:hypothetical protein AK812_SmicGene2868 [Symbiodinium microadriaticum]